jgi:hypothetical protein
MIPRLEKMAVRKSALLRNLMALAGAQKTPPNRGLKEHGFYRY